MEVISLEHVTKEYEVFANPRQRLLYSMLHLKKYQPAIYTAVNNLSFSIKKGEILGIVGRNGAGKSTVLKMITGVSFATTGKINVAGRISSLLELGAGFNPEMTGMENIFFQGSLLGISREEMEKRLDDIQDFAAIGDYIHQPVKNYSSGMFARLAFATAINVDPDILIVDEVLAVGDIAFQFKCIEKMKEFAQQGVTIIFVTHNMMSLYRFCTRALWIDKGKLIMDGLVEDVVPKYEDSLKMVEEASSLESLEIEKSQNTIFEFKNLEMGYPKAKKYIEPHDNLSLKIDYTLGRTLPETPYFALSFVKEGLNYDMFGVFPSQERYTLAAEAGEYQLNVDFEDISLNVGTYTIYFSVLEKNGISQLYFSPIGVLEIEGKLQTLGLVDIKHKVELKRK